MDIINQFKDYLVSKKVNNPTTLKNYLSDIRHFINWYESSFGAAFNANEVNEKIIKLYEGAGGANILPGGGIDSATKMSHASLKRRLSSMRQFAKYLVAAGAIGNNPFTEIAAENPKDQNIDAWHIQEFKDYLKFKKASDLTIKNYVTDIHSFRRWHEQAIQPNTEISSFPVINDQIVEEYKSRLIDHKGAAIRTINRKLSSLRKFVEFSIASNYTSRDFFYPEKKVENLELDKNEPETKGAISLDDIESHKIKLNYSPIPPIRLFQKLIILPYLLLESAVAGKIITLLYGNATLALAAKKALPLINKLNIPGKPSDLLKVKGYEKKFYAPNEISLDNLPLHEKIWHHLRFTRPEWYRRYHNLPLVHYIHFAVLIIFAAGAGVALYRNLVTDVKSPLFAAPASPPRILSFQGRLTDNLDNPITSGTSIRFSIYDDLSSSGSALLWQEVHYGTVPDQDGIFSVLLGTLNSIPDSVFFENNDIYLGVTVEQTEELTPRRRIASVPYAANSESLQGMLPITDGSAGQTNVVLALDSSGDLTIGGSATPTFSATGGQFTLSGDVLLLTTETGTDSNVIISPDGIGKIDLTKPLLNSSSNGNLVPGGVEVNDKFGILATESAVAAFVVNNNGASDIFTASSSGTPRFTITNSGGIGLGSTTAVGTSSQCLLGGSTATWGSCATGTNPSPFQQLNGAIVPNNSTVDFLIGSQATSSAKFAVLNVSSGTPVASVSANNGNNAAFVSGSGTFGTTNRQTATFGGAASGNVVIDAGSNVTQIADTTIQLTGGATTISTTTTNTGLTINTNGSGALTLDSGTTGTIGLGTNTGAKTINIGTNTGAKTINLGTGAAANVLSIGTTNTTSTTTILSGSGNVNIGNATGNGNVNVAPNAGGRAALIVNKLGANDIFAASSSGTTRFLINNSGSIQLAAGQTIDTLTSGTLGIGTTNATTLTLGRSGQGITLPGFTGQNGVLYGTNGTGVLAQATTASTGLCLLSGAANPTWGACTTGGTPPFQELNGAIVPNNSTLDFLIGGQATSSAKFAVININSGTPVASVSGGTNGFGAYLTADGTLATTRRQTLTIGNSATYDTTGELLIHPNGTGNVAIGDTSSGGFRLLLNGNLRSYIAGQGAVQLNHSGLVTSLVAESGIGLGLGAGGSQIIRIASSGEVGVGTTSPFTGNRLDVRGLTGTTATASISAQSSHAALVVDNATGAGDQFTASKSGETVFVIDNDGNIIVGPGGTGKITAAVIDPYLVQNQYTSGNTQLTFQTLAGSNGDFIFQNQSTELATLFQSGQLQLQINGSAGGLKVGDDTQLFRGSADRLDLASGDSFNVVSGNYQVAGTTVIDSSSNATFNDITINGTCLGCVSTGNISPFRELNGAIVPNNSTVDFLVGGQATASAKFAVLNVNGSTSPVASISAATASGGSGNGITLGGDGTIQSLRGNTLTLGGTTTGNLQVANKAGSAFTTFDTVNSRVGIGIENPGAMLDVNQDANAIGLRVTGGSTGTAIARFVRDVGGNGYIDITSNSGDPQLYFDVEDGGTTWSLGIDDDDSDKFKIGYGNAVSAATNALTITNGGNVGIGTATPTLGVLQVTGSLGSTSIESTGNALAFSSASHGYIKTGSSQNLYLQTNGSTTQLTVLSTGNVGIGDTSPASLFTVGNGDLFQVNSSGAIAAATGITSSGTITFSTFSSNGGILYTNGSGVLAQATAGTSGQCLLGGTTPSFGSCSTGTSLSPFQQGAGIIFPNNSTSDFLVGGQATSSAKFAVTGINGTGPATASVSGNLIVMPHNGAGGNVGIGTINPTYPLHIVNSSSAGTGSLITAGQFERSVDNRFVLNIKNTNANPSANASFAGLTAEAHDSFLGSYAKALFGLRKRTNGGSNGETIISAPSNFALYAGRGLDVDTYSNYGTLALYVATSSGGLVGINTTSPDRNLDILDASNPQLRLSQADSSVYADFQMDSNGDLLINVDGASNQLVLDNGGNVGIGTATPAQKFVVYGTSAVNRTQDASGNYNIDIYANGSGPRINFGDVDTASNLFLEFGAYNSINQIDTKNRDFHIYGTNTTTGLYFDESAGTFGLGTTTPTAKLDVSGSASISGALKLYGTPTIQSTANQTLTIGGDTTGNITLSPLNGSGTIRFTNFSTAGGLLYTNSSGVLSQTGAGSGSQCLLGGTTPAWGSCATGITTSPFWGQSNGALYPNNSTVDFLVGGQATSSAKFAVTGINGTGPATASVSGNLIVMPHNGAGGNVGIGTINPQGVLDLTTGSGYEIYFSGSGGGNIYQSNSSPLYINTASGNLNLGANGSGSQHLTIVSSGSVGIGTTGPDRRLDVLDASNPQLRLSQADGTTYADFQVNSSGDLVIGVDGTTNQLVLDNGGNIGFGTATPTAPVHIYKNTDVGATGPTTGSLLIGDVTDGQYLAFDDNEIQAFTSDAASSGTLYLNQDGGNVIIHGSTAGLFTVNTDDLYVAATGNVGIGDTSPASLFTVGNGDLFQVNSSGAIAAATGITSSGTITFSTFSSNGGILYTNGSGVLAQATAGTSGQCLLGGTTPSFGSCSTGTSLSPFQQGAGIIFPNNSTSDFLVGGQATSSAKFAVLNVNGTGGAIATVSGSLIVMPRNGDGGFLGVQTDTPRGALDVGRGTAYFGNPGVTHAMINSYDGFYFNTDADNNASNGDIRFGTDRQGTSGGTELLTLLSGGGVGIRTTAPDAGLEINHPTGANLRLTYNDSDGSAANYADFSTSSGGNLTIAPSGGNSNITGTLDVSGGAAFGSNGATAADRLIDIDTTTTTAQGTFMSIVNSSVANAAITSVYGLHNRVDVGASGVINDLFGIYAVNPTNSGSVTSNYGIYVGDQTAGTNDYGLAIAGADTQALWVGSGANNTDAANGIAFGSSRDTNLYRSAADTLRTDDAFNVNGNLNITSAGAISAATGITSSGAITFSGFSSNGGVLYTNGSGVLAQATAGTSGQCLLGGTTPSFGSCSTGTSLSPFQQGAGIIFPNNSTSDFLVGGQATSSAKFAVLNINSGTPVASVSSGLSGYGTYITADGTLSTTRRQTLTIGNSSTYNTTGNVLINPNGTGNVGIGTTSPSSLLTVSSAAVYNSNSSNALSIINPADSTKKLNIGYDPNLGTDGSGFIQAIRAGTNNGSPLLLNALGGNVGIGTTGPDARLDVLSPAGGTQLRLTSTDGSVYTDLKTDQIGDLTITPSGGDASISGTLDVSSYAAFGAEGTIDSTKIINAYQSYTGSSTAYGAYSLRYQTTNSNSNSIIGAYGIGGAFGLGANTLTWGRGVQGYAYQSGTGTVTNAASLYAQATSGTIGTGYGLYIEDQTAATSDYGIAIAGADTAALWLSSAADNTDAANGIAFGSSRDTNLYRSAADTLRTDDTLDVGANIKLNNVLYSDGNLYLDLDNNNDGSNSLLVRDGANSTIFTLDESGNITGTGTLTGLTGLTSSGTITFSGLSGQNGVLYGTNGTGVLAQATTASTGLCLVSGASNPSWGSCSTGGTDSPFYAGAGFIGQNNTTLDFLLGGSATSSAKFAVLNVNNGVPVASVSAGTTNGAAYLTADGTLATTRKQTLTLGGTTTGNIAIGTDATARTISLGNSTGATALNFTSGTGAQTFTSSNATGTGTSSGFVFTANSLNTGTAGYINSSSITTGKLLNLATTGNTLTTGTLLNLSSTATSLTGTTGIGSMLNLDWSPGSTTNATGDLFALNIGGNGSTTGKLFNILDNGSSLFSVSETAVTSNLPASFNAAGDVSIAYDLVFTNPTASYITSNAPLSIRAGELFNSSNLTLGTYNKGNIIADTEAFVTNASATVSAQLVVGSATAPANIGGLYLTNSRVFGKALAIFNQTENQDIFTASSSGTPRFSITNAGGIRLGAAEGASGECLKSGGAGVAASWATCSTGSAGVFQQLAGSIVPNNSTLDFLIGGQATASAKFAVLNVNGSTSPVASISATTASGGDGNGITLGGDGTIQSLRGNTLTLGGTTTGNINVNNKAGSAFATFDTINSRLGIGTTAPSTKLQVVEGNVQESISLLSGAGNQYAAYGLGNTGVNSWWAYVGGTGQYSALSVENDVVYKNAGGNVIHYIGNNTGNFKFSTGTSETLKMELTNSGLLGIGQSGPTSALYVTRPLSYGVTGKALAVFDQIESQDILAASASGATKFRIGNAGDITIYGDMLPATDDTIELGSTDFAYNTVWTNSVAAGGTDFAEYHKKSNPNEEFEAGQLVCLDNTGGATKCSNNVSHSILGVISDDAAFIGGSNHNEDPNYVLVGLVGQLGVKVIGDIKPGDPLTISSTPGYAQKATGEGHIVGRAMESNQNGTKPRVYTSIKPIYYSPNLALNTQGDDTATFIASLNISEQNGAWSIRDAAGNVIDRTSAFSNLVAATMKTGFLNAQKITTNSLTATTGVFTNFTSGVANITTATVGSLSVGSENVLIAGTSLRDYVAGIVQEVISDNVFTTDSEIVSPIASIDRINTNIISPLADGASIEIEVKPESIAINNTTTGEKVTEIDNNGNATFSGQLASDTLKTNDATISGTLTADRIIANTIDGLDEKISSIASQLVAGSTQQATDGETSTNSGSLATNYQLPTTISELEAGNIYADFGIYSQGLTVLGSTTTSQLTAMDSIAIGTGFIMTDNSINTLGATLQIQPLRQGAIDFMAGRVTIDTDGNVDIAGNLNVAGIINAPEGVFDNLRTNNLATNIISPLGDSDLTIKLGGDNQASGSSNLRVTGSNGNEVLKISGEGNIAASGSATFDKLNFNLVGEALADSDTTAIATGSAGFATLLRNKPEITIYNDKITANSLIYITPFGDTQNKVIHLLRQIPHTDTSDGSFTIGVSGTPANADIQFNWLIVN